METNKFSGNARFHYWYLPLILGLIFLMLGVVIIMTPVQFFITLSILFSIAFLATGILEIAYAASNRKELDNWGWSLAGGVIDVLIGILLLSKPEISMIILPFIIGFAILFRSIMTIGWSFQVRKFGDRDWGWLLATGIVGGIFAFILLWNPVFAGLTIAIYAALSFIVIGIFQIILAFRLKKLKY